MDNFLYTLWIRGGNPLSFSTRANPSVDHDGGTSVSHLMLTRIEAEEIKSLLVSNGSRATIELMAGQNKEQEKERLALLGRGKEEEVWPSRWCQSCTWFDPVAKDPCGMRSWDPSAIEVRLKSERGSSDWERCDATHATT